MFFDIAKCQCFDDLKKGMIIRIDCNDPTIAVYNIITFKNKKYYIFNPIVEVGNEEYYQIGVLNGWKVYKNNDRALSFVYSKFTEPKHQAFFNQAFFDKYGEHGWKLCRHQDS
jgi:hypothetical protein